MKTFILRKKLNSSKLEILLPPEFKNRLDREPPKIVISDYIAGMTDRFALQEYKKLFDPFERV